MSQVNSIGSFLINGRWRTFEEKICLDCGTKRIARKDSKVSRCPPCQARRASKPGKPRPNIRTGQIKICQRCGQEFYARKCEQHYRFCSPECANTAKRTPEKKIKVHARTEANKAKLRGDLVPESCEVCGNPDAQMHHDDYSKPLLVRWLCRKHHDELHVKRGDLKAKAAGL